MAPECEACNVTELSRKAFWSTLMAVRVRSNGDFVLILMLVCLSPCLPASAGGRMNSWESWWFDFQLCDPVVWYSHTTFNSTTEQVLLSLTFLWILPKNMLVYYVCICWASTGSFSHLSDPPLTSEINTLKICLPSQYCPEKNYIFLCLFHCVCACPEGVCGLWVNLWALDDGRRHCFLIKTIEK